MVSPLDPGVLHRNDSVAKSQLAGPQSNDASRTEKLSQACQDFESIFINYMMQQMRKTVPQDGLFGGGQGEELFTSMMDGEMAKSISQNQSLGLAPQMFRQLIAQTAIEKKSP